MKFKSFLLEFMLLTEDKISYLANQQSAKILAAAKADDQKFETAEEVVKALTKADPTVKLDYLMFIVRMYIAKQFKMEDLARIKDDLTLFSKIRPKLSVEQRDLNKTKDLDGLLAIITPYQQAPEEDILSKSASEKKMKNDSAKTLISTPNFKVIHPLTEEAACLYGANTKWCTAAKDNNMFSSYNEDGPLYIVIAKINGKQRKFQFHYQSDSAMNELDRPITKAEISQLSKIPEYKDFLEHLIDLHYTPLLDEK